MSTRIFDLIRESVERNPDKTAFSCYRKNRQLNFSFREYKDRADRISCGLLSIGVKKGDKISTVSPNRPEWNFLDMAIMQIGAVHVPIHPSYNYSDITLLLNNSDCRFAFVSGNIMAQSLFQRAQDLPHVERIFSFDNSQNGIECIEDLMKQGLQISDSELKKSISQVSANDTASIMFSSGTYWKPMGVEVLHQALSRMTIDLSNNYQLDNNDLAISYLPLSHMYERAHSYSYQFRGCTIHYVDSTRTLLQNISTLRPSIFTSVPSILEELFREIKSSTEETDSDGTHQALTFAENYVPDVGNTSNPRGLFHDTFNAWKSQLGNRIRVISCAAAPLRPSLVNTFWAMGIQLLETYGLTEAPLICINTPRTGVKSGTVGPPANSVKVKLSNDGEILVQSPYLFKCYYKDELRTSEAFDKSGWFHTGDIGVWVDSKYLKIIGRKKVIFKLANGQYIIPERVETTLQGSDAVHQAIVFESEGCPDALIVPSASILHSAGSHQIQERLIHEVNRLYNDHVESVARINKIHLCHEPWTLEKGDLTPSMKPRRKVILNKYLSNGLKNGYSTRI